MTSSAQPGMVRQLAESYAKARAEREAADALAKDLREKEDDLKAQLINEMSLQQMPSVRLDGLGRFVIKNNSQYAITDLELFTRAILQRIVDNGKAGRPLSDGLLLQKRPAKTVIEELLETGYFTGASLAEKGLAQSDKLDLTFTRQKV